LANKNYTSNSARSRSARILSLILVILMLLGAASTVLLFLFAGNRSTDISMEQTQMITTEEGGHSLD